MKNFDQVEHRIDDLKWRALPLYDRLMMTRERMKEKRYCCSERRRELKSMILQSNLAILMFVGILSYIIYYGDQYSEGLYWLFVTSLVLFFAQRIELSFRLMCLKEVKFLKQLKKKFTAFKLSE